MICGRKLSLFLLVFSLVLGPLYSLSQEEKETLPLLSKQTLIEIILEYDRGLTIAEDALTSLQDSTEKERKILDEEKKALALQEEVFLTSLEMQKKISLKNKIIYCGIGLITGYIIADTINLFDNR